MGKMVGETPASLEGIRDDALRKEKTSEPFGLQAVEVNGVLLKLLPHLPVRFLIVLKPVQGWLYADFPASGVERPGFGAVEVEQSTIGVE